jgi:urease accessory protein
MRQAIARLEADAPAEVSGVLTLPFDDRRKSRLRATLTSGEELAVILPRGTILADGDRLRCDDGGVVLVTAAPETLSEVISDDAFALTRAAYHLGNRHVPLQIGRGRLCYQHDHVLDDMVRGLGLPLQVRSVREPFQPERGAYGGGHRHGDQHEASDHHHDHHDHDVAAHGHDDHDHSRRGR